MTDGKKIMLPTERLDYSPIAGRRRLGDEVHFALKEGFQGLV